MGHKEVIAKEKLCGCVSLCVCVFHKNSYPPPFSFFIQQTLIFHIALRQMLLHFSASLCFSLEGIFDGTHSRF